MVEYKKVNVKLSDSPLNKLKSAVKNREGLTLRMNIKFFNGNNLPHEFLSTTRKTTKLSNAFHSNMSTDIKFSKIEIHVIHMILSEITGSSMKPAVSLEKIFYLN